MGVVARKTFSHTPDEAMSDGLAKACGLGKMYSVKENISHFIENNSTIATHDQTYKGQTNI